MVCIPMKGIRNQQFASSIKRLSCNSGISIRTAEANLQLGEGYFEKIILGVTDMTLEEAVKIASYYKTTIESLLDCGCNEIRIQNRFSHNTQSSTCFTEALNSYERVLFLKYMEQYTHGAAGEELALAKEDLEISEKRFIDCHCNYMSEFEKKKIQPRRVMEIEESVLIAEMERRGFLVERKKNNGKKTYKSGRKSVL